MARALRIQYPGAIYHVMNRGDRREPIFRDDLDHKRFLDTLAEVCTKTDWQVHAFVLMGNHFHLVVETPDANLVAGMRWFLSTYTARFNRRHKLFGHLDACGKPTLQSLRANQQRTRSGFVSKAWSDPIASVNVNRLRNQPARQVRSCRRIVYSDELLNG